MFNTVSLNEEKNRKKGLKISMFFHTAILLLALYPILNGSLEEDPKTPQAQIVMVDFTHEESSSSSNAKAQASKDGGKEETVRKTEAKYVPTPTPPVVKPEPKPDPRPPVVKPPVVTTSEPNPPMRAPVPSTRAKMKKWEKRPKPTPVETPKVEATPKTDKSDKVETGDTKATKTTGKDNSKANNKTTAGSGNGNGDSNNKSDNDGNGKADDGFADGDFSGEGIFGRRVVHHGDVKSITSKQGKIVVNLCVDRVGKVIFTEFDKKASTIKSGDIISKALSVTKEYRFDTDYTAAPKQCGHLTYIFDLGN